MFTGRMSENGKTKRYKSEGPSVSPSETDASSYLASSSSCTTRIESLWIRHLDYLRDRGSAMHGDIVSITIIHEANSKFVKRCDSYENRSDNDEVPRYDASSSSCSEISSTREFRDESSSSGARTPPVYPSFTVEFCKKTFRAQKRHCPNFQCDLLDWY